MIPNLIDQQENIKKNKASAKRTSVDTYKMPVAQAHRLLDLLLPLARRHTLQPSAARTTCMV